MSTEPERDRLQAMESLLEAERDALLAGQLDRLEEFAQRKSDLVAVFQASEGGLDPAAIRRVGAAAERNRALLAAASDGLRSALRRIAELREMQVGKGTYGASGQRHDMPLPPRVTRRV